METENMTGKEIENAIDQLLNSAMIDYNAKLIGERERDGWKHDEWRVTFKRRGAGKPAIVDFEFNTGVGLRAKPKSGPFIDDARPVKPRAASVLYSLTMDASARDQCFDDWCCEYGYDNDSIKALNIYTACCENGKKLRQLFTIAEIRQIADLTSNY